MLIDKRNYIKEHCKIISEQMNKGSQYGQIKAKEVSQQAYSIGVTVVHATGSGLGNKRKGGKKKAAHERNQAENHKALVSNYDLIKELGFDMFDMEAQKRQQAREKQLQNAKSFDGYVLDIQ